MIKQCKNLLILIRDWFSWLAPVAVFLLALIIPTKFFHLDFLRFIDILAWPITVLTGLFFFKKVFTYLFFSMNEFNFFGLKGHLRNINEVILEEVNKKFSEKEEQEERRLAAERLSLEISKKEEEINEAKGTAAENLKLAKSVLDSWKKAIKEKDKFIKEIEEKNKRISELLSSIPTKFNTETNISEVVDDTKTSDPILEETND